MNAIFPLSYFKAVIVLVTLSQNLRATEFCTVELDSAVDLEVSVWRLWLFVLSHFCLAHHLALFYPSS